MSHTKQSTKELEPVYRYELVSGFIEHEDLGEYFTYGIQVLQRDRSGNFHEVLSVLDITTDKMFIEKAIYILNTSNLSVIHFYDVLEDLLFS